MISVLGIPYDEASSFLRGCAAGPAAIREAFRSPSANTSAENGQDLGALAALNDAGDVALGEGAAAREQIEAAVAALLQQGERVFALGGDHAVTYPILRAYGRHYPNLNVLHLDAHPDLYDELDGNRYSHACPFARALEEGLIGRLVQVGIRTMNDHQKAQAERFGVEVVTMREWTAARRFPFDGPVYLSLDLDVLDPAYAPGISHYEPGGFSTRQLLGLIQSLACDLVGADIVELNPTRDFQNMTAMVAAKCFKEVAVKLLASAG